MMSIEISKCMRTITQLMFGLIAACSFLVLQIWCSPYVQPGNNLLAMAANLGTQRAVLAFLQQREGRGCVAHPKPVSQHRNQVEQERREGSVLSDLHEELVLRVNELRGEIPRELGRLQRLLVLDLSVFFSLNNNERVIETGNKERT